MRLVKRHQGTARFYSFEEFEALVAAARKCRLANARPDPDFRYASKALAASVVEKSIATSSRHGRPVVVCRESPRLCAARRAPTSLVRPVYQRAGCDWLRRT